MSSIFNTIAHLSSRPFFRRSFSLIIDLSFFPFGVNVDFSFFSFSVFYHIETLTLVRISFDVVSF